MGDQVSAPRLDLAELRRLHEAATGAAIVQTNSRDDDCGVSVAHKHSGPFDEPPHGMKCPACQKLAAAWNALPALLSIAEATEAWLERGSTLDTHAALRAALAAVRKEEKGD